MNYLLTPPSLDDLIRLLKAWRFWMLGAIFGALIGSAIYTIIPPPFRAQATVNVDFNLEQAWPQETDRQQFYYLERETRKLEETAYSDVVLEAVTEAHQNITLEELRNGRLLLSQPAEGGWNFYVDDKTPEQATALATAWANAFVDQVRIQTATADGLNSFIDVSLSRTAAMPVERSAAQSLYIFVGAVIFLMIGSILVLFFNKPQ